MTRVTDDGGVRHVLPSGREIILPAAARPSRGRSRSWRPYAWIIAAIAVVDLIALNSLGGADPGDKVPAAGIAAPKTSSPPPASAAVSRSPASSAAASASTPRGAPKAVVVAAGEVPGCALSGGSIAPAPTGVCAWTGGAAASAASGTTTLLTEHDYALKTGSRVSVAGATWKIVSVRQRGRGEGIDPTAFAGRSGPRQLYVITSGATSDSYARAVPAGS